MLKKAGLYRIHWEESAGGGTSLAAVGFNPDGSQWIAPTNWVNGPLPLDKIVDIRYMEKIVTEVDEAEFPVAVLGERPVVEIDLCFSVLIRERLTWLTARFCSSSSRTEWEWTS